MRHRSPAALVLGAWMVLGCSAYFVGALQTRASFSDSADSRVSIAARTWATEPLQASQNSIDSPVEPDADARSAPGDDAEIPSIPPNVPRAGGEDDGQATEPPESTEQPPSPEAPTDSIADPEDDGADSDDAAEPDESDDATATVEPSEEDETSSGATAEPPVVEDAGDSPADEGAL